MHILNKREQEWSEPKEGGEGLSNYDLFFQKVVEYCGVSLYQLAQELGVVDYRAEQMWQLVKHVLSQAPVFLYKRCLDQLILCAIYSICKVANLSIKFQDIVKKYQQLDGDSANSHQVIYEVLIHENEKADIITFYNKRFIPTFKQFLINLSNNNNTNNNDNDNDGNNTYNSNSNHYLSRQQFQSPLKQLIPADLKQKLTHLKTKSQHSLVPPSHSHFMTPRTHFLYAYQESPTVKHQFRATQAPLNSRKVLNFDDD